MTSKPDIVGDLLALSNSIASRKTPLLGEREDALIAISLSLAAIHMIEAQEAKRAEA